MANIGDQLLQPEEGWKRYDDNDGNITYIGSGWNVESNSVYFGGARHVCPNSTINPKIQFNFTGDKLRLISSAYPTYSDKLEIIIDGISCGFFSQSFNSQTQTIFYQTQELSFTEHCVEIVKINAGSYSVDFILDAIDITESGELLPYKTVFLKKNLIKSQNKIQTISEEGEWIDTGLIEPLTKADFENYGIHDLSVITKEQWGGLGDNFEIITWTEAEFIPKIELTIPEIRPYKLLDNPSIVVYTENTEVPILSQTVVAKSYFRFLVSKDKTNYQVYRDGIWSTVNKPDILEQGMTSTELEFIPQETWADWMGREAYKNSFDILIGMYSENPHQPLVRSISVQYSDNESPIIIDANIEPDTIHNEFATVKADVKDYEGDKISFKVLIKKAGSNEFVQVSPLEGWYDRSTSETEITQTFNFPYFNPGENEIKLVVKDERGAEAEWVGKIILSNTNPTITLTYNDFSMKATIGDDDSDDIAYRILINGNLIFDYTNFVPTKAQVNYVFDTTKLKFGEENIITLEVKDTHGGRVEQDFTVIGTYRGLMFKNEEGKYFVDSKGEVLMDLLFDKTLIGGQISETKKVILENRHEFPISNVVIEAENPNFVDGAVLELSETEMPFNPQSIIKVIETLPSIGTKDFYVRVKTDRTAHQGSYFYIKSTASSVIE